MQLGGNGYTGDLADIIGALGDQSSADDVISSMDLDLTNPRTDRPDPAPVETGWGNSLVDRDDTIVDNQGVTRYTIGSTRQSPSHQFGDFEFLAELFNYGNVSPHVKAGLENSVYGPWGMHGTPPENAHGRTYSLNNVPVIEVNPETYWFSPYDREYINDTYRHEGSHVGQRYADHVPNMTAWKEHGVSPTFWGKVKGAFNNRSDDADEYITRYFDWANSSLGNFSKTQAESWLDAYRKDFNINWDAVNEYYHSLNEHYDHHNNL